MGVVEDQIEMNWKEICFGLFGLVFGVHTWITGELGGKNGAHFTLEENPIHVGIAIALGLVLGVYYLVNGIREEH